MDTTYASKSIKISPATSTALQAAKTYRIASIDLFRGLIMIIMALDHARDFMHDRTLNGFDPVDLSTTTPVFFLTRWVTHLCAPNFIFIAGVSIFLSGRHKTKKELSFFLFTRGLWLMLAEVILVEPAWAFSYSYSSFGLAVIWVIGLSMVCLSALIFLPKTVLLILSILLIFVHNLLDPFSSVENNFGGFIWSVLHVPHNFQIAKGHIMTVDYMLLPWLGVMSAGYLFGQIMSSSFPVLKRSKILLLAGCGGLLLFLLLRAGNFYGDPSSWSTQASPPFTVFSFINVTKYPPSLLYILLMISPALLFLFFAEKKTKMLQGWLSKKISVIGRVPFFYYLLHILLLRVFSVVLFLVQGFHPNGHGWFPKGMGIPLWQVYALWILAVVLLYPLCKWYDRYKSTHKEKWWLSYL